MSNHYLYHNTLPLSVCSTFSQKLLIPLGEILHGSSNAQGYKQYGLCSMNFSIFHLLVASYLQAVHKITTMQSPRYILNPFMQRIIAFYLFLAGKYS